MRRAQSRPSRCLQRMQSLQKITALSGRSAAYRSFSAVPPDRTLVLSAKKCRCLAHNVEKYY